MTIKENIGLSLLVVWLKLFYKPYQRYMGTNPSGKCHGSLRKCQYIDNPMDNPP